MSGIRVTVDINATGTSVRGLVVATDRIRVVRFSGWLELMQALDRLICESYPVEAKEAH
jgi:hypothetical protein